MTQCAKCSAELIGTKKFCTACGTPAGDPRSPAASTGMSPAAQGSAPASAPGAPPPSIQYAPAPASQVNPFAQTSGPRQSSPASSYGPPPSAPSELASTAPRVVDPSKGPQVSPLATSNVDSSRGALLEAIVASARGIPGTQLMPSIANPSVGPGAAPSGAPSAGGQPSTPGQKRPDRTQLIGVFPGVPPLTGAPAPSSVAPPARAPSKPEISPHGPTPFAVAPPPLQAEVPQAPPPPPPPPPPPHAGPGVPLPPPQQGWNAAAYGSAVPAYAPPMPPAPVPPAAAPPPGYGYGFSYAPGSRVTVTWSNGQRYPGTVTQVAGNQCLVAFPDGQHHWVEMQYVAPG